MPLYQKGWLPAEAVSFKRQITQDQVFSGDIKVIWLPVTVFSVQTLPYKQKHGFILQHKILPTLVHWTWVTHGVPVCVHALIYNSTSSDVGQQNHYYFGSSGDQAFSHTQQHFKPSDADYDEAQINTMWLRFIQFIFKATCRTVRPNDPVLQIRAFIPEFIALGQRAVYHLE